MECMAMEKSLICVGFKTVTDLFLEMVSHADGICLII